MSFPADFAKTAVRSVARRIGFDVIRVRPASTQKTYPADFSSADIEIFDSVREYTMTTPENIKCLIDAVRYIVRCGLDGALVECGVWRGGSSMVMALTLRQMGDMTRDLYLFDTFSGMNRPTQLDAFPDGNPAMEEFLRTRTSSDASSWCFAPLEEVKANIEKTGYPGDYVHFIEGKVEKTLPSRSPDKIALLRLDTDWYESTKHELEHLFPRLAHHGVLIVDDYGYWSGARKAVEEYMQEHKLRWFLHRVDRSSRLVLNCPWPGGSKISDQQSQPETNPAH